MKITVLTTCLLFLQVSFSYAFTAESFGKYLVIDLGKSQRYIRKDIITSFMFINVYDKDKGRDNDCLGIDIMTSETDLRSVSSRRPSISANKIIEYRLDHGNERLFYDFIEAFKKELNR